MTDRKAGQDRPDMNPWLFFRRWLANPREVGSVAPSSPALKRRLTQEIVRAPDEYVIELGGGTGAITRGILERGVPADRLYVLEINPEMAQHLRDIFPGIHVIEGDARRLAEILPPEVVGKVGTTVCGIPMLLLTLEEQKAILDSAYSVMPKGRQVVLYTYALSSPLPRDKLGLAGRRVGFVPANIPPASVWAYRQRSAG
ncbi:class I SAM-dependent methyltransferase [Inquilinus sp. YAF38]|uniref:class I SAM-dependent methyltransferase n=1 Tax=Inquilinus sp. YAF38 TaxID=3233084 RepID=UPI003F91FD5A